MEQKVEHEKPYFLGYVSPPGSKVPCIYRFTQIGTDKTYIGSTVNNYGRFITHTSALARGEHFNKKFQEAYNESPYFEIEFIRVPEHRKGEDTIKVIREYEQLLIDEFKDKSKLLNIATDTLATQRGYVPSQETRDKISRSLMGRPVSEETRRKHALDATGRKMSEEAKAKIREKSLEPERIAIAIENAKKATEAIRVPVMIGEVKFPSIKEAADSVDVCASSLRKRINSSNPLFAEYKYADNDPAITQF